MRKLLIALIVFLCIVLAAAVFLWVYMEKASQDATPTDASSESGTTGTEDAAGTTEAPGTEDTTATTEVPGTEDTTQTPESTGGEEETTAPSQTFSTEAPEEAIPGYTFSDEATAPAATDPTGNTTEPDPDELETPGMKF